MAAKRREQAGSEINTQNPRRQSIKAAAELLGVDRNTLTKWVKEKGCPYVQQGDRSKGQPWIVDLGAILWWREEQAAEAVARRYGDHGDDNVLDYETARARKETAQAALAEQELAERRGEVVRVDEVARRVRDDFADVRMNLLQIPGQVAPTLAHLETAREIQDKLHEQISRSIESLRTDVRYGDPDAANDDEDDDA